MPKPPEPVGKYRGRRRLPKLPGPRYFGVVLTAIVGAAVVALAAGAVLPNSAAGKYAGGASAEANVQDRLSAANQANRSEDRPGPANSVDQSAPDLWLLPLHCDYEITTLYAMRWGEFHYGDDLACPLGTPYYATHSVRSLLAGWNGGFGNCIEIDNGNGILTIYGHGSKLLVSVGDHVTAGENIGLVGSTGFSTGNHLHYEVHVNGQPTDPMPFMLARGVDIQRHLEAASGATIVM